MKKRAFFLSMLTILFSFVLVLSAAAKSENSIEDSIKQELKEANVSEDEIPYIKVPFSFVLDERNPSIKIKTDKNKDIKLIIKKEKEDGVLKLSIFKDKTLISEENITSDFEREFSSKDVDEILLDSYGKFLVEAFKLEIIADMEFNIPKETASFEEDNESNFETEDFNNFKEVKEVKKLSEENNQSVPVIEKEETIEIVKEPEESFEKKIKLSEENKNVVVETEIVSAEDTEAFEKATNNKISIENNDSLEEDNKIILVKDKTPDKKEFVANVRKEIENSSFIEKEKKKSLDTPAIVAPSLETEIPKEEIKDKEAVLTPPRILEDEKLQAPKKDNFVKEIIQENEKSQNFSQKPSENINSEKVVVSTPKELKNGVEIEEKEISDKNNFIEKNDEQNFSPPSFKEEPLKIAAPVLSMNKPSIRENFKEKKVSNFSIVKNVEEPKPEDIEKPNIQSSEIEDREVKKIALLKLNKEKDVLPLKPNIENRDLSVSPPKIETSDMSVKEENFKKPNIKIAKDINPKTPNLIRKEIKIDEIGIDIKKPKIAEKSLLPSKPSIDDIDIKNVKAKNKKVEKDSQVKQVKGEGKLQIFVLKENKPIVGWIDIIDQDSKKIVANGDTFNQNPITFTLPSGKYTIVITDKKVVPPLQEKFYDVEVLPGETVVKKTKFSQGTLTVNVTKNSEPIATAFVRVYDERTNDKVLDDNTYKNNPVKVKLPQGSYYLEVEDYSIVPKQLKRIENIEIQEGKNVIKSINFEEGELVLRTFKNSQPVGIRYEIYPSGGKIKIKSGYTGENGETKLKLASGFYDIKAVNKSTVLKSIKTFKDIKISPRTLTELNIEFKEGKLKILSERNGEPLYTNVSIYKPGKRDKRLYFDFTSRSDGVVVMKLPVGVYDVVVRDHNIKRVFKRVRIKPSSTTDIHAKF